MRIDVWAGSLLRSAVLLLALGCTLQALAGVRIEQFGYRKFAPPSTFIDFVDNFDAGGPLVSSSFAWQMRVGEEPSEDSGLRFRPWSEGAPFSIGPYITWSQVMELQTSGASAITSERSNFTVFAVYELGSIRRDGVFAGVGLTDVFRGAGTRAIANTFGREGDRYYGKFSNALTGDVVDKDWLDIPSGTQFLEFFISRAGIDSDSVEAGYGFRDASLNLLDFKLYSGTQLAFSEVELSPVIFAGTLIPEPETWALMIAGLALIGYRALGRKMGRI